jgi:hypothetical protein
MVSPALIGAIICRPGMPDNAADGGRVVRILLRLWVSISFAAHLFQPHNLRPDETESSDPATIGRTPLIEWHPADA